jgi:hypothetical protein
MTDKILDFERESEEERLEELVKKMAREGHSRLQIHDYLRRVANRYLAEMGYDIN